jgi:putative AlgH/UPF0301 family transcriptional regulator
MKRLSRTLGYVAAALALVTTVAARAADLSEPVILVASPRLDGSPLEQTVVVAAPLPSGGHIGFIVNKPTTVKLETLLPEDAAARKVTEPVYLGGPQMLPGIFVVTRHPPADGGATVPLGSGFVAVLDAPTVDRIMEETPNDARYFVGVMVWEPDELEDQAAQNAWEVRAADSATILGAKATGLWNALRRPMAALETKERAAA